jgi:glutathione synthase/RimK-type ligase-like ATP-grasp enzyme
MKIAIHKEKGSFSDSWIAYCEEKGIAYKAVNCYDNNIIQQIADCDAVMWNHYQASEKDLVFAKQFLFAVEGSGKKVFPDFNTGWHYDDKVGQKYLFESIGAPLVPSYVFYSKDSAVKWINETDFPKVFKLRNGAGSWNVKLVRTKGEALKLADIAFGKGFAHQHKPLDYLKEIWRKYKLGKKRIGHVRGALKRLVYVPKRERKLSREFNYIYFQEFIPNNDFDIRVIVIAGNAFAIKRMVRENDFRASGSGNLIFGKENFDQETIKLAQDISNKIKCMSAAFDIIYDNNRPLVVEISYTFPYKNFIEGCEGYWDKDLVWHEGKFNPYGWMVETLLQ